MSDVFQSDGDEVTNFTAHLPAATMDAPEAFPRGTLLTLTVQVRVRGWGIEEDRKGNVTRKHVLAMDHVIITDVLTPDDRKKLIEAAEAAALADEPPEDYTVNEYDPPVPSEEPTATYSRPVGEGHQQVAQDASADGKIVALTVDIVENNITYDYVPTDQDRGLSTDVDDPEDNDPAHSWMDDDEEPGVHVDNDDLRAVVGF